MPSTVYRDASAIVASRIFYAADCLAGMAVGAPCPSCGRRRNPVVISKLHGLGSIRKCLACGLLYRPAAFIGSVATRWYYSRAYAAAGVATEPELWWARHELSGRIAAERKDRSEAVRYFLADLPERRQTVCVLGCSWGYEVELLLRIGVDAYGVEPSHPRRLFGREKLKLDVYGTLEEAAARRGATTGLVLSSHVLEHIASLEPTLDTIESRLIPLVQLHFTPNVEPTTPHGSVKHIVGREHPLGVTSEFWTYYARKRRKRVRLEYANGETLAILSA